MRKSFKNDIIKLRSEGNTYKQIIEKLGCSMGVICYHLDERQKQKDSERHLKFNRTHPLYSKVLSFTKDSLIKITVQDVLDKFGKNPICYLTGEPIDLRKSSTYQLDHIVPRSRGGTDTIDNLGLLSSSANKAKHSLLVNEVYELCEKIIAHKNDNTFKYDITIPQYELIKKNEFKSDEQIIDIAVNFFTSNGNKIWERAWFRYSKEIGLPQGYTSIRFNGQGYKGLIEFVKQQLDNLNVSWTEDNFILTKSERYKKKI